MKIYIMRTTWVWVKFKVRKAWIGKNELTDSSFTYVMYIYIYEYINYTQYIFNLNKFKSSTGAVCIATDLLQTGSK